MQNRIDEFLAQRRDKFSNGRTYQTFDTTTRDEFCHYVNEIDRLDGTRTYFTKMTLSDMNRLDTGPIGGMDYPHHRLDTLIRKLLGKHNRAHVYSHDSVLRDGGNTVRQWKDVCTMFSLRTLQQEPRFMSPITASILGNGDMRFNPGTTRRIFAGSRHETMDVMITNYSNDTSQLHPNWKMVDDHVMRDYSFNRMVCAEFTTQFPRATNSMPYFKKITTEYNSMCSMTKTDTITLELNNDTVLIDGVALCERINDKWIMISS